LESLANLVPYLPIPAFLISLLSIGLAYASYKRTKVFQEYEYAPRLQLNEEEMVRSWEDVEEMKERYNVNQAMFFLRVSFYRPNGNLEESVRSLGGYDGSTTVFVSQRSTRLT
jgi:hypothetical protein